MIDWYPFEANKIEIIRATYLARPRTILELGSYIGIDSLILATLCEQLTCVESREENAGELSRRLESFGLTARIHVANLEAGNLQRFGGSFACVWASGIIYHLPEPWRLMSEIASVTSLCLGWSHVACEASEVSGGYGGQHWSEDTRKALAGMSDQSFWLTEDEFVRAWADAGMECRWLTPREPHPNGGAAAQFISVRKD